MTHERYQQLLPAYFRRELDAAPLEELEVHLLGCTACQDAADEQELIHLARKHRDVLEEVERRRKEGFELAVRMPTAIVETAEGLAQRLRDFVLALGPSGVQTMIPVQVRSGSRGAGLPSVPTSVEDAAERLGGGKSVQFSATGGGRFQARCAASGDALELRQVCLADGTEAEVIELHRLLADVPSGADASSEIVVSLERDAEGRFVIPRDMLAGDLTLIVRR